MGQKLGKLVEGFLPNEPTNQSQPTNYSQNKAKTSPNQDLLLFAPQEAGAKAASTASRPRSRTEPVLALGAKIEARHQGQRAETTGILVVFLKFFFGFPWVWFKAENNRI